MHFNYWCVLSMPWLAFVQNEGVVALVPLVITEYISVNV